MRSQVLEGDFEIISAPDESCTVQTEGVDASLWNQVVESFEDATLAQTWPYGVTRWGRENLKHVVMRKNGAVVAAAQVVVKRVPLFRAGLAYIKNGPLWQRKGFCPNTSHLAQILRALHQIFAVEQGLLLRVFAAGSDNSGFSQESIFRAEGFGRDLSIGRPSTAIVNLSHSLEELRGSLRPTWRRNLVLAERKQFTVFEGVSDELFARFALLYKQMLDRKSIAGVVSINQYRRMQRELPDSLKMRIMICEYEGEPVAGLIVPWIGNSAQNLLAATGDKGLELRSSYLLHWRMLQRLKTAGFRWYDLDAINHKLYPGISQFKLGLAGKLGWEASYLGQFEACARPMSAHFVSVAERLKTINVNARVAWKRLRNPRQATIVSRE